MTATTENIYVKDYFFNIIYRAQPISTLDNSIEKLAEARGGMSTGSGYCLQSGERDITVAFDNHMAANKFRADVLTEPELVNQTEGLSVEVSDIDQYSRIESLLDVENEDVPF